MTNSLQIGKRLLPLNQIVMVEPFDAAQAAKIESARSFNGRLVLLNRDSVLTEEMPSAFAEKHGFRAIAEDGVVINPAVSFSVETFTPQEGFSPTKPYKTRLLWKDSGATQHSRLLVAAPETVLAIAIGGEAHAVAGQATPGSVAASRQRKSRRRMPQPA